MGHDEQNNSDRNKSTKRYSLQELIADEDLFKNLIDLKKDDLQTQLAEKQQSKSASRIADGRDEGLNVNSNNYMKPNLPVDRFRGVCCIESPSNTTVYASTGKIQQERSVQQALQDDSPQNLSSDTSYGRSDDSIITPNLFSPEDNRVNGLISDLDKLSSSMGKSKKAMS